MSDLRNLIYNADFSKGKDGWISSATIEDNVLTIKGNLANYKLIPISQDATYRLSFDIKFLETDGSSSFYIAMHPFDSSRSFIPVNSTLKYMPHQCDTTLATAVKNGDTSITLTSSSSWYNSTTAYRRQLGLCNNIAWGYNRSTANARYSSISGNVLTLENAWSLGSFPAGTKVSNFSDGGTYFYPWHIGHSGLPKEWKHINVGFSGESVRFSTAYVQFCTLGYGHTYSMKNIRLENVTSIQTNSENRDVEDSGNTVIELSIDADISPSTTTECGKKIRHIKDTINGSTANTANHWVEIQAFDPNGVNLAYNKNTNMDNQGWTKNYITDGSTASNPYNGCGAGTKSVIVDLGFVTEISEIKVWHYWEDGRTYHDHTVSVSDDEGQTWEVVYQGERPETSEGLTIKLGPNKNSIHKTNRLESKRIIEY